MHPQRWRTPEEIAHLKSCDECWSRMERRFHCADCGYNTRQNEYYAVTPAVWRQAIRRGKGNGTIMLCIGCLEARLGRLLTPADFADAACNDDNPARQSARIRNRLGL